MRTVNWLNGKKTYFVAAVLALHALIVEGWVNNDWSAAQQELLAAAGMGSLRHALPNK